MLLETNPDAVCRLIELAHVIHGEEEVVIPEVPNSPAEDWGRQMLADHAGDPSTQEFKKIVADLEPDQQQEVVALLWLGRGDYTLEEWDEALEIANEQWSPETGDYLLQHPMLADYLGEALDQHGYNCEDSSFITHPE